MHAHHGCVWLKSVFRRVRINLIVLLLCLTTMPRVLTACSSMAAKVWLSNDTQIEIKMSFNIQTGAVVAGYRQVRPMYTGWNGWVGTWQWYAPNNGLIVILPGLPVLVLSLQMVRMSTTLISQRMLGDREVFFFDDEDGWIVPYF